MSDDYIYYVEDYNDSYLSNNTEASLLNDHRHGSTPYNEQSGRYDIDNSGGVPMDKPTGIQTRVAKGTPGGRGGQYAYNVSPELIGEMNKAIIQSVAQNYLHYIGDSNRWNNVRTGALKQAINEGKLYYNQESNLFTWEIADLQRDREDKGGPVSVRYYANLVVNGRPGWTNATNMRWKSLNGFRRSKEFGPSQPKPVFTLTPEQQTFIADVMQKGFVKALENYIKEGTE